MVNLWKIAEEKFLPVKFLSIDAVNIQGIVGCELLKKVFAHEVGTTEHQHVSLVISSIFKFHFQFCFKFFSCDNNFALFNFSKIFKL